MSDTIEKYNPSAIMKNVTDKIKVTFAELIPDEEWQKLVEKQVNIFMENKKPEYGKVEPSEFTVMCQSILQDMAKEHIKKHLKEVYEKKFDENNELIEDAVKDLLVNNASLMFANMMQQSANTIIANMQYQQNTQYRN